MTTTAQTRQIQSITLQQSLALMKNVLRSSISEICYLRNLFDESCFEDKGYAGIRIKAIKTQRSAENGQIIADNEEIAHLVETLERGIFDALEKQYVEAFIINLCDTKNDVLESYQFIFKYSDNQITMNFQNNCVNTESANSREQAVQLIRNLISLCSAKTKLHFPLHLSLEIIYIKNKVPNDYSPIHLNQTNELTVLNRKNLIGSISTNYHNMSLYFPLNESQISYSPDQLSIIYSYLSDLLSINVINSKSEFPSNFNLTNIDREDFYIYLIKNQCISELSKNPPKFKPNIINIQKLMTEIMNNNSNLVQDAKRKSYKDPNLLTNSKIPGPIVSSPKDSIKIPNRKRVYGKNTEKSNKRIK